MKERLKILLVAGIFTINTLCLTPVTFVNASEVKTEEKSKSKEEKKTNEAVKEQVLEVMTELVTEEPAPIEIPVVEETVEPSVEDNEDVIPETDAPAAPEITVPETEPVADPETSAPETSAPETEAPVESDVSDPTSETTGTEDSKAGDSNETEEAGGEGIDNIPETEPATVESESSETESGTEVSEDKETEKNSETVSETTGESEGTSEKTSEVMTETTSESETETESETENKKETEKETEKQEEQDPAISYEQIAGEPIYVLGNYPAANIGENTNRIYEFLTKKLGLNHAAACGVLANIQCESNFSTTAVGDGGTSYGICQWHLGRFSALISFCSSNDYDFHLLEGQLYYLASELSGGYNGVLNYLLSVPDTEQGAYDAAYYWCRHFEMPSNIEYNSQMRGDLARNEFFPRTLGVEKKEKVTKKNTTNERKEAEKIVDEAPVELAGLGAMHGYDTCLVEKLISDLRSNHVIE